MRKMRFLAFFLALLAILVISVPVAAAPVQQSGQAHVKLPVDLHGTLNSAEYEIVVPVNWNGTLLMYVHGYEAVLPTAQALPDIQINGVSAKTLLLGMGYALAGTANSQAGWAVKQGIQDNLALTNFFKGHVGNPSRVILMGFSMGSAIALESIEKYPGIYDGVISGGSLGAGTPKNFDLSLGFSIAYKAAFGWPAAWGTVGNVPDDLNFNTDVLPVLLYQQATDPNYAGKIEFIRLVCGFPQDVYGITPPWFFTDMFYATQVRAELESRAGGPVAQNLDQVYSLSGNVLVGGFPVPVITYLGSLGVNAPALLAEMNATKISASVSARNYAEHYATPSGNLKHPVITIQTRVDEVVNNANEGIYRDLVDNGGKSDFLVQVFTTSVGHVNFSGQQLLDVLIAMNYWLDSGQKPGPAYFPQGDGFNPGFVPPSWPFSS